MTWVFVHRDPMDCADWLYAERSRHNVALNYKEMIRAISKRGYFDIANRNYDCKFVFDVPRFAKELSARVDGSVEVFKFLEFVTDCVGTPLITRLIGELGSWALARKYGAHHKTLRH